MTRDEGLVGLPVEEATERVVDGVDRDPETVRRALAAVSDDGVVSRAAVEDALAELSEAVAAPGSRLERAEAALADARAAAEPVADAAAVRARIEAFEADLAALADRIDALGSRLDDLVERARDPDDLYAVALEMRRLREEAADAGEAADALAADAEAFERRLRNPGAWAGELREDVAALEESVGELREAVGALADGADGAEVDPGVAWADAALQHRVRELFVADVRTELDALGRLAAGEAADVERRLEELAAARAEVGDRLDDVFEPAWGRAYGEVVVSFDEALEAFEPPVDWAELQAELQRHRERLRGE